MMALEKNEFDRELSKMLRILGVPSVDNHIRDR